MDEQDEADLDWLLSVGEIARHPRGSVLVEAGRPLDALYLLLEGTCSAHLKSRRVARIRPGEIVGEVSFLDHRLPTVDVTAAEDVRVVEIPRGPLEERLRDNPAFAARLYHGLAILLAARLREAVATVDDESEPIDHPAVERFAEFARRLSARLPTRR